MLISPYDEDELEFYGLVNDIVQFREKYGMRELAKTLVESMQEDTDFLIDEITNAKDHKDGIYD